MKAANTQATGLLRRSPSKVMKLARMGSMHQTRLSFMRVLLRRMAKEQWQIERRFWNVDASGVGVAVYTATGPERTYSLVVFANDLDPSKRSDRVIAEEWDATFTLVDGIPTEADISRLQSNVPSQEAGRISASELSLSRANRSVRLFDYVRSRLAAGDQPSSDELDKVGYLMRTTAVYGSGKFGALDRQFIADRDEFRAPFQTELMAVYLIRLFSVDIVEHLAFADSPNTAVKLDKKLRRSLGIGNSTGLGMAPFIVNHPVLFNQWMQAREEALLRVRSVVEVSTEQVEAFVLLLKRQRQGLQHWVSEHELQIAKIADLTQDLQRLDKKLTDFDLYKQNMPWDKLFDWAETHLSLEGQECLVTLLLEMHPELVDELSDSMSIDETLTFTIDGQMRVSQLINVIEQHYQFALCIEFGDRQATAKYWYASEEKLEPRIGDRYLEPGAELEHPLAIARDIKAAYTDLRKVTADEPIAAFLLVHPQHRHVVRRAQQVACYPYAEIEDNLIADNMLPIDLLRCKLSFFGAVKFDPRSDRWVRINMFQHAPLPDDLASNYDDSWVYPTLTSHA